MRKRKFISMLISIAMVVTMTPFVISADPVAIRINAADFPDANFLGFVLDLENDLGNGDGEMSEFDVCLDGLSVSVSLCENCGDPLSASALECGADLCEMCGFVDDGDDEPAPREEYIHRGDT